VTVSEEEEEEEEEEGLKEISPSALHPDKSMSH
jgi:hypothetical protein